MANLTVNIDLEQMAQNTVKKQFRELLSIYLCGALGVDGPATAEDWFLYKVAQFRGESESEVQEMLNDFWKSL